MAFEDQVRELARGASLNVYEVTPKHATLIFTMASGQKQILWILPFGDVWEFSVQSAIKVDKPDGFPQWLLVTLLTKNSKNKRGYWCIETISGKHILSAMTNFPSSALSASEFNTICWALVREVEKLEQAFVAVIAESQGMKH
jgi:hypothetical protein